MKPTPQLDIFPTVSGQNQTSTESQFSTSYSSSQESRPGLLRTIIPEEDDETSTGDETAEPLTPDNEHPPLSFPNKMDKPTCDAQTEPAVLMQPTLAINTRTPTILQTSATPPQSSGSADSRTPISGIRSPKAATPRRQGSMSADAARRISGLFKRANSHTGPDGMSDNRSEIVSTGGDAAVENDPRRHSARIMPQSTSTTRSNTPPGSLDIDHQSKAQLQLQEPSPQQLFKPGKQRSSTVLQIRDKLSRGKAKLGVIANGGPPPERPESKKRAGSVDMRAHESGFQFGDLGPIEGRSLERDILGNQAETGTGLKSRRLSLSLPDDFLVDVAELHSEYKDQSKIIGRRGTLVGSGGSANVKLMYRKNTEELYAVKEFRGKGSKEIASEYEKKIKSEFTIAKSAHHPNIVETFRLCKYKGRWFDVMEYCEGGDLFSLVQQRYLSKEERADDRRCLFVQLIRGIDFLHGNGIAHRDIKLDNLLITKDSKLKITDFGVSEVFCGLHPGMRAAGGHCGRDMKDVRLCTPGISGTKPYLAPEVLSKKEHYDPRLLDVWGAAIVMISMIFNGQLWDEATPGTSPQYDDLAKAWDTWNAKHRDEEGNDIPAEDGDYPHLKVFKTNVNPPALRKILLKMLNPDPKKRLTIKQVAAKGWVKNAECCQIDSHDEPTGFDASNKKTWSQARVVQHNHLPPEKHSTQFHKLPGLPTGGY